MNITHSNGLRFLTILQILFIFLILSGCSGEEGTDGSSEENLVGLEVHEDFFATTSYEGTKTCLKCHDDIGDDVLKTGHWNWQGFATNIEGQETELHGKNDLINNFCIAVPSNEGRCAECHIGYGYVADKAYDFNNAENIDCLVCHDQTGSYKKSITEAGVPDSSVDLQAVATSVGKNEGVPQRANCIGCHANAGGGDNVKHGDLSTALLNTTREYDVHMGTDGGNFTCVTCHDVERTHAGEQLGHGIGGMPFHSVEEGSMKQCSGCHGENDEAHAAKDLGGLFSAPNNEPRHQRLACQVCHIPAIARQVSTKTVWNWEDAGKDYPVLIDPISGRPTYDNKKGTFKWEFNVRPVLRVHNGKWNKVMINVNDTYETPPVMMAEPAANPSDQTAMIYPFKRMIGKQIADKNNKTMLAPHLFGLAGGPNPYWEKYDWDLALEDGAAYTGQTYSGNGAFEFVETEMFLSVNHEVAPGEMSLGKDNKCTDCHSPDLIDWPSLGHNSDPYKP